MIISEQLAVSAGDRLMWRVEQSLAALVGSARRVLGMHVVDVSVRLVNSLKQRRDMIMSLQVLVFSS